ncbi:hypothetical protein M3Y99_00385300 [Aphelenchoides fujianensis]|nr:hypothetical protein M3Y99_00385300 [Aphelenchoides fujianensis]
MPSSNRLNVPLLRPTAIDRRSSNFQWFYRKDTREPEPCAFGDDFCRRRSIVLRGVDLTYKGNVRQRAVLELPCAGCPLGACTCGPLALFDRLWESKTEQIDLLADRTESPSWMNSAMFGRFRFLDRLQQQLHGNSKEEEKIPLDETNRSDLLALLAAFRRLSPKRRWALASGLKGAESERAERENARTFLLTSPYTVHSLWQYPATSLEKPPTGRLHEAQRVLFHMAHMEVRGQYVFQEWYKRSKRPTCTNLRFLREPLKRPSKTALEAERKREEEKDVAARSVAPFAQFLRESKPNGHQRNVKKSRQSCGRPSHLKRKVENEWKLPAALMTYDEPLDFNEQEGALEDEGFPVRSPITMSDFIHEKMRAESLILHAAQLPLST